MKRFTIQCDFAGVQAPFNVYVGEPSPGRHPLHYQSNWLYRERGGNIPQETMDEYQRILDISRENNVSFEELCVYRFAERAGDDRLIGITDEAGQA